MVINGKNYILKYGLRAMFAFEEMTGKSFEISTLLDTYCFCYACLISNQENPSLEFNEFIDWCDEHPDTIKEFNDFMNQELKRRDALSSEKKKVSRGRPRKNSQ